LAWARSYSACSIQIVEHPAFLVWLANPILFIAWALTVARLRPVAIGFAVLALLVGGAFILAPNLPANQFGMDRQIMALDWGYWLWLASMAVTVAAAVTTQSRL
jgi:hypothetical protein